MKSGRRHRKLSERVWHSLRIGRALALVWQSARGWTVLSVALVVVQAGLPLLALYLMKLVVDTLATAVAAPGSVEFGRVLGLLAFVALVGLLAAVARSAAALASEAQGHMVTDHVLGVLHRKSVEVDLGYYEDARYHDTLHRAQREAPFRPPRILNNLLQVGQSGLTVVGIVVLLATIHWIVAALLFIAVVPALWVRLRWADRAYEWQRRRASTERRALYVDRILVEPRHAKEVRLFQLGSVLMQRFRDFRDKLRRERIEMALRRNVAEVAAHVTAALAVFGCFALIAYRTHQGALTLGDLVMYFGAVQRGQSLLQSLFNGLGGLYEDNLFLSALDDFLNVSARIVAPEHPRPVPKPMRGGFAFEGVSFRYPTSSRPLLEEIHLGVRPGEMVALIGRNGSGKSTLVKLLCRLYDPTTGRVTLDGIDLRELRPEDLRRQIAVVLQDFACYQLPARDNIGFGDVHRPNDDGRVSEAARMAGIDEVIRALRGGYDANLGNWFEDGNELSTGEWQKVALARAFFREAQLIVLDEPTSALDAQAEVEVFDRIRALTPHCAAIVISHRFSTVRMADRIYVLDGGRIAEAGTHDELMRRRGLYCTMFNLQAAPYRDGAGRHDAAPRARLALHEPD